MSLVADIGPRTPCNLRGRRAPTGDESLRAGSLIGHAMHRTHPLPDRPTRSDLDPAALALLQRHRAEITRTARRYAATPADAEDAFQLAFEILLTRAPTTDEAELVPWLKTVVKHEAFALRRARDAHTRKRTG